MKLVNREMWEYPLEVKLYIWRHACDSCYSTGDPTSARYLSDISGFCVAEVTYTMKKKQIFWASVCLLLSCASVHLNVDYEDDEDYPDYLDTTGKTLAAFLFFMLVKALNLNPKIWYRAFHCIGKLVLSKWHFFLGNVLHVMWGVKTNTKGRSAQKEVTSARKMWGFVVVFQAITLTTELFLTYWEEQ